MACSVGGIRGEGEVKQTVLDRLDRGRQSESKNFHILTPQILLKHVPPTSIVMGDIGREEPDRL